MTPLDRRPDYGLLTATLVGEVLGWTGPNRRFSPPVRGELLRVLPAVLVDAASRQAYLGRLDDLRRDASTKRQMNRAVAGVDIPLDTLARSGLEVLSDEQLAAVSTDPIQLEATADAFDACAQAGELGPMWWDAMSQIGHAAYHAPGAGVPPTRPRLPRRLSTILPWAVTVAAVLFAGVVWWTGGPRGGPTGELAATSSLSRQPVLGADTVYTLAVRSPADGFVTVVLLPPDGPPMTVYPQFGDADNAVTKGEANVGSLTGKPGTRVMAFVTPTPATETIRKATVSLKAVPNLSPDTVIRVVTDELRTARHPWVAVTGVQQIP